MIWMIWFSNQLFILIILLNFLIAIVSQSYEQVMSCAEINMYMHRAILNRECRFLLQGNLIPFDVLIFSVEKETDCDKDLDIEIHDMNKKIDELKQSMVEVLAALKQK
jgi:hypothetical protein